MRALKPLNLDRWIEEHRALLVPPVGNKVIYDDQDFIVMAVGGPNARSDFHVDPAEELFYQLEGDITLRIREAHGFADVHIRAGELLLLPANVPHSPQRPPHSVGLVVERRRRPGELDGLQWYCDQCGHLLYEEFFQLQNIERQFPPVFARFFGSPALRACGECHAVMSVPAHGPH